MSSCIPAHEHEILLQKAWHVATGLRLSRADLLARAHDPLPPIVRQLLDQWTQRRAAGALLQHLTGEQQFLDHIYSVGPGVLVPRPETEVLVSAVVPTLDDGLNPSSRVGTTVGWEIGVGSGCVSIELLAMVPGLQMIATEVSPEAYKYAERNARDILGESWHERLILLEPEDEREVLGAFFRAKVPRADFIVSNPPYLVRHSEEATHEVAVHEPEQALYAPDGDPLFYYRKIFEGVGEALKPGGRVFVEIPHERADELLELAQHRMSKVELYNDLTGRPRVLSAR